MQPRAVGEHSKLSQLGMMTESSARGIWAQGLPSIQMFPFTCSVGRTIPEQKQSPGGLKKKPHFATKFKQIPEWDHRHPGHIKPFLCPYQLRLHSTPKLWNHHLNFSQCPETPPWISHGLSSVCSPSFLCNSLRPHSSMWPRTVCGSHDNLPA